MMFYSVVSKLRLRVAIVLALSVSVSVAQVRSGEADSVRWFEVDEEDMSNSEDYNSSAQRFFQSQHSFRGSGRVVDQQTLYQEAAVTFQNTLCTDPNFSMFCEMLESTISGRNAVSSRSNLAGAFVDFDLDFTQEFTLFAPANSAFMEDGRVIRTVLPAGLSVEDFLNNHIIDNRAYSFDQLSRICFFQLPTRFEWTRTICDPITSTPIYQSGPGNSATDRPRFLDREYTDIPAGKGIIHAIDNFIKPRQFLPPTPPPTPAPVPITMTVNSFDINTIGSLERDQVPIEEETQSPFNIGTIGSVDRETIPPVTPRPSTSPSMSPSMTPSMTPSETPSVTPSTMSPTPVEMDPLNMNKDGQDIDSFESPTWSPTTIDHTWEPTETTLEPTTLQFMRDNNVNSINQMEERPITTGAPTATPTASPTATPTVMPSFSPTFSPTEAPSATPTATPSALPSDYPSLVVSTSPSEATRVGLANLQIDSAQEAPRLTKRQRQREKRRKKRQEREKAIPADGTAIDDAAVENDITESEKRAKRQRQREKRRQRRKEASESPTPSITPIASGDESRRQ